MSLFHRLPLHWRLTLLITGVCAVALAVAFAGYFFLEASRLRAEVAERVAPLQTLLSERAANTLAANPEATDFGLNVLEPDPLMVAAAIYDAGGNLRARYVRAGSAEIIPEPRDYAFELSADHLVIFRPLVRDQTRLGTLYLRAEVGSLVRSRLIEPVRGMAMLFLGTLLLALIASRLLQRTISRPITALASTAQYVAQVRDYSIRTHGTGGSETAALVEAFNSMLAAIQQRDAELTVAREHAESARSRLAVINARLEEANQTLEANVRLRTAELERALGVAHDASEAKSAFLARMSHELRTPLNAIIGYSEMLLEDADERSDATAARDLRRILDSARHLLALISDVLDYSKLEAGHSELRLTRFALAPVLDEVSATVRPLVAHGRNRLSVLAPPDLGEVTADAGKLKQILLNLLGNSAKFTEQGEIFLRASRQPGDTGDLIALEVVDTGVGMDEVQLSRLFTPFFQATPAAGSRHGGTGLGLVISRQFARLMGGDITVSSSPRRGSTFRVVLPATVTQPRDAARGLESGPILP